MKKTEIKKRAAVRHLAYQELRTLVCNSDGVYSLLDTEDYTLPKRSNLQADLRCYDAISSKADLNEGMERLTPVFDLARSYNAAKRDLLARMEQQAADLEAAYMGKVRALVKVM